MLDLFVYGTLMEPAVIRSVSGYVGNGEIAALHGFRRRRVVGELYPAIVRWPGETVEGRLYRQVTPAQLQRLDRFEGNLYRREAVEVIDRSGRPCTAQSYVLAAAHQACLSGDPWSLENFLANDLSRFLADYPGFRDLADGDGGP